MPAPRIRIFSDLHFGDPRSALDRLDALAPLLADADEFVLNGDSLDTVVPDHASHLAALRAYFAATARPTVFLSGNHDPDISALTELSLAEDRVWVTHGDVLFDHVAPWSHHAPEFARLLADAPPAEADTLEARLRQHRHACVALMSAPHFLAHPPGPPALRLLRTLFPPRRLVAMLGAWRHAPRLAATLATRHRPRARVIILGHTHFPGVWTQPEAPDLCVINTGAFARPFGGAFVELQGPRVQVRRIVRRADAFYPGRSLADFTLPPASSPAPL